MDTIYALATARGRSGLAVVRVSGPAAFAAGLALCGPLPAPRVAGLRRLTWGGELLDEALVVCFAEGASFTGEAVVELHCHGGPAVVGAVLRALADQPGLRLAEPGEFTRRALENGVLDLAQVEGLADLIDAETEAQRRQAVRVLSGSVGQKVEGWRRDLIRAGALLEATIDFADEDVPVDVSPEVLTLIDGLMTDFGREAAGVAAAERIRDGFEVAIVGAPNAGKSTLLNQLAGREAAIVSDIPGTTRDIVEVRLALDGYVVVLSDTAGLRASDDPIEAEGVRRARARAAEADLRVFVVAPGSPDSGLRVGLETDGLARPGDIVFRNKADLGVAAGDLEGTDGLVVLTGSALTGDLGGLLEALRARVADRAAGAGVLITRARHREALAEAWGGLQRAQAASPDLAAEDVRLALRALARIVGRFDVEAVLDRIFAAFCIGK
jgi:tRNA modification GTPase